MYGRVLLCYAGSAEARGALQEGARLARATGAETHLLAISRKLTHSSVPEGFTQELLDWEKLVARELLEEGIKILGELGIRAIGATALGTGFAHVPAYASDIKADLIVIGHRPKGALLGWWHSSASSALLNRAPCPVLIASNKDRH